ncbi:MAG: DUF58 domain-containing protein [Reyranella sp.]|uniref:DUF58 domain-containing protein n=1 Tax=Reyranella sp. TaxID=1929291 RepID=UPI001ACDEF36|nr:DUF58 domain-containing protein [Reyranella sp.]MBN9085289.1 DUF58 domain-containing protein [Reyranella sp.]
MARAWVTLDDLLKLDHRARGFSFLPRQPVHSLLTGRHASRLRGRGLDFDELRHYYEGDDTRTIDWAATARLGTPYVRVYREERDRPVLLLVDQRVSMFFGSKRATKSVVAAEVAALAAFRVASLGDRVGGIVYSEQGIDEIEPQARQAGVRRLLGALVRHNNALKADVPHPPDAGLYDEALRRASRYAKHDCLVVLISDGSGQTPETMKLATGLAAHNDLIAIFVYDPLEADLPDIGRAVLAEGDRQIEVDLSAADLRRRFAAGFVEGRARIERAALQRAIPVLPIRTDLDPAQQLRALIGRRMRPAA